MSTIRLTWNAVAGAVSYNIYNAQRPGLSTALSPLLTNVNAGTYQITYDHTGLSSGDQYYIIAAVGPNNEVGPPSAEIHVTV